MKTLEQAEHWSDLMPVVTWALWLARPVVADKPLPWQKAQAALTPGRVKPGFEGILAQIGTPARAPKAQRPAASGLTRILVIKVQDDPRSALPSRFALV